MTDHHNSSVHDVCIPRHVRRLDVANRVEDRDEFVAVMVDMLDQFDQAEWACERAYLVSQMYQLLDTRAGHEMLRLRRQLACVVCDKAREFSGDSVLHGAPFFVKHAFDSAVAVAAARCTS